jgi:signal transduction histidine kinase/CheY-like chemotaxis protein
MKPFYFIFLFLCIIFFVLLRFSPWWSLVVVGAAMLFSAFHFYKSRLVGAESRSRDLEKEVDDLHLQLDSSLAKEQRSYKEAETAKNVKRLLLSTVNHEVRTPMNGILGMTTLLVETSLNTDQREYVDTIRSCGEHLLTAVNDILVSDLLNYSKAELTGEELEKGDFEVRNCVEEVLKIFAERMEEGGPELAYRIDEQVPEQLNGDRKRLSQVLMNLLENALRYTPTGEVFLDVRCGGKAMDNRLDLVFEVRDTGSGIAPNKMEGLFKGINSVEQGDGPEKKQSGLGLVVCKKLVELMGGNIGVASEPGNGAAFTFNILARPALRPKHSPVNGAFAGTGEIIVVRSAKLQEETKKRTMSEDFAREFPLRILVAEDHPVNQKLILTVLARLGYSAALARNGKEVLEMVDHEPYDLILMDVQMPEMDGLEATRMLRLCLDRQPVIIAMTANAMHGDQDACIQAGMDDYICKPVELDELLVRLEKWGSAIKVKKQESTIK